jgi:hypothetical protein
MTVLLAGWQAARSRRLSHVKFWLFPSAAKAPGRGRLAENRRCLDKRRGAHYGFSEMSRRARSRLRTGTDSGARDSQRNEKAVKPLKTNNPAKWPDFAP